MREIGRSVGGIALASTMCLAVAVSDAHAEDAPDFFDDINSRRSATQKESSSSETTPVSWSVDGFVKQQAMYAIDDQDRAFPFSRRYAGLAQFRSTLNTSLNGPLSGNGAWRISASGFYDAYYHGAGKDEVTREEYSDQADEAEWREVFANFEPVEHVWLKGGRQIIAWGESDFTQILDLVNPRDARDPGLVDLEDARLPIWATRLSYVGARWGTDVVVTHEFEPNRLGAKGSDYDPFIRLRSLLDIADDKDADSTSTGFLWRGFASFPRGDIGIIYARVHDHSAVLESAGGNDIVLTYPRIGALGVNANVVTGYWLLKIEYAHKTALRFARNDWTAQLASASPQLSIAKPLDQWMVGVEYSGVGDTQMSIEWVGGRIGDYESVLAPRRTDSSFSGRISTDFWNATASVELVWAHWTAPAGDSARLTFTYSISDAVKFSIGGILYAAADPDALLYPYRRNDRVYSSVRYSF